MKETKTVCVVGSGFMGTQITSQTLLHDFNVNLFDIDSDSLQNAKKFVKGFLRRKKAIEKLNNLKLIDELPNAVENADLVIEAIPEKLDLKKEVFSQIDKYAPEHTIIATNSSSFPVSRIEDSVERKDKVLNIHFYPPIKVRPMADIMRGTQTSEKTFEIGKKWIEEIDCAPLVVKKESYGFLFNRLWRACKKEALEIWAGGYADIEGIDKAWRIFTGMPTGPFVMMDGIGLDTVYNVEVSYYKETGELRDKPPEALKQKVEKGELGIKTGRGFYDWKKKHKKHG
ncbi:MAG: 3-hydroxyacyl-CoA dehydrogenase family protein [Candidatus Lokiarchaeota archaeon]|nr:3-hydroxyacyl-CoA dehydrogenase family protein [Candidatus Lokiarchaeota archaeon]MBD3338849.1 3-hydroxyacyl-CoA dehydrogenase family protein [Candidatus Lokiarchaeota archaeon]